MNYIHLEVNPEYWWIYLLALIFAVQTVSSFKTDNISVYAHIFLVLVSLGCIVVGLFEGSVSCVIIGSVYSIKVIYGAAKKLKYRRWRSVVRSEHSDTPDIARIRRK